MMRNTPAWVIAGLLLLSSCSTEKPQNTLSYPEPSPDSTALVFLPGVVSADSLDFGSAFSPDGKSFYFARSTPSRRGWSIRVTHFNGKDWSSPEIASHIEPVHSAADPFITSDGLIYFISNRPRNASDTVPDYDIWVVRPQSSGGWSEPENVPGVNSDSSEYYVSLAANGNLYFASDRAGGYGSFDIYVSELKDGEYAAPVNLGPAVNSVEMEHDPLILPDENTLIFTAVNRKDGFGEADLYYAVRTENGTWDASKNLGDRINTPTYEYCPAITSDNKYFFYSSEYEVKWIDVNALAVHVNR